MLLLVCFKYYKDLSSVTPEQSAIIGLPYNTGVKLDQ